MIKKDYKKVLSIIVPSYNVERYLEQTLQSFVAQSLLDKIEVLIVDDGSKDGTADIGQRYEAKYPASFRLISKENGGHGSTINTGIQECCGAYFKVVDGDDWVITENLIKLVDKLETCSGDYVVTDYTEVYEDTKEKKRISFPHLAREEKMPFDEAAKSYQIGMHPLFIRSDILKNNNITLDEHCFYVDVEYILYPIPYVETVQYIPLEIYQYRLARENQSVSISGYQKHMDNHIKVIYSLADFASRYKAGGKEEKINYIGKRIAQMVGDQVTIFLSFGENDKEIKKRFIQFDQKLLEKSPWIYRISGEESGTLRLLRKTGFRLYKSIVANARKRNDIA